ncbi:hypothetical protein [Algicella marina]|uniref:hypothetical protein n=1 Tax=Algicella marina TaxID=2683284 RepID=UPI0024E0148F|nr:hypothetical protein [Algicella marina]
MLICATRPGDNLTASTYFSYPAFGRAVTTPDNAIHDMIKHGPSKFVIELDQLCDVLFQPPTDCVSQLHDYSMRKAAKTV